MSDPNALAPDDALAILRARAQALARRDEAVAPTASLELLEFRLARERYAIETRHVSEVLPLSDLTPVPCTPPFILGVVNVRGRITAVVDIRKFFGLPARGLADLHHVVLVRGRELEFGIPADVIVAVRAHPLESLQPASPALTGIGMEYVRGVTAERLVVLQLEAILADPRLIVHDDAARP